MPIDRYNVGWAASMKMRKEGVDKYLDSHRKQAKPMVNVDVLVFVGIVLLVVALLAFLMGYREGQADRTVKQSLSVPYSPATKCTSYDIRDGQKYCLTWRRV